MLHREGIQPSSLFPSSHYSEPHISMNEGTAVVEKNDMLCCRERDVLHGLQYRKWCYYLWPLHSVIRLSPLSFVVPALWWGRSHISPCYLHIAVIILCAPSPSHSFWYSTLFTITGFAAHTQYRQSVMNKLSIRVKAQSYSEVTCILLPF